MSGRRYSPFTRVVAYVTSVAFALQPMVVWANPQGGVVSSGAATISQSGNTTTINQTSANAVIDWASFNIDAGEATHFVQPSASAMALNRIHSADASQINGTLTSNGGIILLNPNGVVFGAGANVNVGSLIATTAGISNADFMAGNYDFNQVSPNADAAIINHGQITAADAGLVGLVAPQVENHGVISARLGKVQLAAGERFTLDMANDGLIKVAVDSDSLANQKLLNSGTLRADGGQVLMTASAARQQVDSLISNTGVVQANAVGTKNGAIVLYAQGATGTSKTGKSTVTNSGTISAKGTSSGEKGGAIHLLADQVGLMDSAEVDASGAAGGGEVLVGGEFQGGGVHSTLTDALLADFYGGQDIPNAWRTYVSADARIDVSATESGDAGRAIVWADDVTRFYGHIEGTAKGAGAGAFAEVSGKGYLDFNGTVSLDSETGESGELLLDPTDIVISSAGDNNVNGSSPFSPTLDDGPSNLSIASLVSAFNSTSTITVRTRSSGSQQGNITVSDAISALTNSRLILSAANQIIINAAITMRRLTLEAADVVINALLSPTATSVTVLTIQGLSSNTAMGIAGGAGTFSLDVSDINNFKDQGWDDVQIGRSNNTALLDVGAVSDWGNIGELTLISATNAVQFSGAQNFGNVPVYVRSKDININASVNGTNTLTLDPNGGGTSLAIGTGATGNYVLDNTELANIQNGFSKVVIGRSNLNTDTNVTASNIGFNLELLHGTGDLTVSNPLNMGANNLTMVLFGNYNIAPLSGTGALSLYSRSTGGVIGIGDGAGGSAINFSDSLLDTSIQPGWDLVTIGLANGGTATMNVMARTWNYPVYLRGGQSAITISGDQNMGANNLYIGGGDLNLNANLTGSGKLYLRPYSTAYSIGLAGATGNYNVNAAELDRIQDGWSEINIGYPDEGTGYIAANAYTWSDPVVFNRTFGEFRINGAQTMGSNNLTFYGSSINLAADLIGTGDLWFKPSGTSSSIGLGANSGNLALNSTELGYIQSGWNEVIFGRDDSVGSIELYAAALNNKTTIRSLSGAVYVYGNWNMGNNDLSIITDNFMSLSGAGVLTGTGNLYLMSQSTDKDIGIGASNSSDITFLSSALTRLQDGWGGIHFGRDDSTGNMDVFNNFAFRDPMYFHTGSGTIRLQNAPAIVGGSNASLNFLSKVVAQGDYDIDLSSAGAGYGGISFANYANDIRGYLKSNGGNINLAGASTITTAAAYNQINAGTGNINFDSTANWDAGAKTVMLTSDSVSGTGTFTGSQAIWFYTATDNINQSVGDDAPAAPWKLSSATLNGLSNFAIARVGSNTFTGDINIGTVSPSVTLFLKTPGDINQNGVVTSTSTGYSNSALIFDGNRYINTAGANSLLTPNARYLVYSVDPRNDTRGVTSGFGKRYNKTYSTYNPTVVAETGNMFIYSYAPTMTIVADNASREYGLANPSFTYSATGLIDGDVLADFTTGSGSVTSVAGVGSDVGSYTLTMNAGTLAAAKGYSIAGYTNGTLNVTPATLTVTADDATRIEGEDNPSFAGSIAGFRNSDTDSVISGLLYQTLANKSSAPGNYVIRPSGASATNYVFDYVNGRLTVEAAPANNTLDANRIAVASTRQIGAAQGANNTRQTPRFARQGQGQRTGSSNDGGMARVPLNAPQTVWSDFEFIRATQDILERFFTGSNSAGVNQQGANRQSI